MSTSNRCVELDFRDSGSTPDGSIRAWSLTRTRRRAKEEMSERWYIFSELGCNNGDRVDPVAVVRSLRKLGCRVTIFYPTPITDGVVTEYKITPEGFSESVNSLWQMRADIINRHGREVGNIYRACKRELKCRECALASQLGAQCSIHYPFRYLPVSRSGLGVYLRGLAGR